MKVFAGLTGGIAGGKSEACRMFASLGAEVIDADILSREVIALGTKGDRQMRAAFPYAYAEGRLNRTVLKEVVFSNSSLLEKLNEITHPLISAKAVRCYEQSSAQIVLFAAPLLFEAKLESLTKPNITVSCPHETRINRLMKRDNIITELAEKMIASQWTDKMREEKSQFVIHNDGSLEQLLTQVNNVYAALLRICKGRKLNHY